MDEPLLSTTMNEDTNPLPTSQPMPNMAHSSPSPTPSIASQQVAAILNDGMNAARSAPTESISMVSQQAAVSPNNGLIAAAAASQTLREQIDELKESIKREKQNVKSRDEIITEHLNTIIVIGDKNSALEERVSVLESANEDLRKDNTAKAGFAMTYMSQLTELRSEYDELKVRLHFTEGQRNRAHVDSEESENQFNQLHTDNRLLQRKYDDEVREHANANVQLNSQIKQLDADLQNQKQQLEAELQSQKQQLEGKVQQLESYLESQKQQLMESQSHAQRLRTERDDSRRICQETASELTEERQKLEREVKVGRALHATNQEQSSKIDDLEHQLAQAQEDCNRVTARAETSESNLSSAEAILRRERLAIARYFAAESRVQPVDDEA